MILGAILLHERLQPSEMLGMAIIAGSGGDGHSVAIKTESS